MQWGVFDQVLSGLVPAFGVLIAGAVIAVIRTRRNAVKDDIGDMNELTDFFFDKPSNPRTRTPGTKGWTTKVDEQLSDHGEQLGTIHSKVDQILTVSTQGAEAARKAAVAAESEVREQHKERARVAEREAKRNV